MLLSWVIDLLRHTSKKAPLDRPHLRLLTRTLRHCLRRAEDLGHATMRESDGGAFDNGTLCRCLMTPVSDRQVGDSSYILLRFAIMLRCIKEANLLTVAGLSTQSRHLDRAHDILFERLEPRLHEQLSYAEIVDSRFDPTELIFCLEGMLIIRMDAVSRALFDRVMSVLRDVQETEGYWRAETPIVYNNKGEVLFTVSVESANSILASFALFDGRWAGHESTASQHIDLIKRYWKWLKARKSFVRIAGTNLRGWHSEHVNDPDLIHLWETSQVAEFLVNFRDQLKRHIARSSLALARCSFREPQRPPAIKSDTKFLQTLEGRWRAAIASYEPVTCLGPRFEVYRRIEEGFVNPRIREKDKLKYSMLVYGPPGTGKTTVASALSWALNYPLITVTVSDFLADGHAAIEARAKDLFDMLQAQPRSVVLFDEIDQFMLDRDSEYFKDQDTVFQFLTPGMLTKLNDLRASQSVIFIMATNYAERIDAAIKRQGRIDDHLLLLPPDKERRRRFAKNIWPTGTVDLNEAAKRSVFLGYGDMNSVMAVTGSRLLTELNNLSRPARPEMYSSRFYDKTRNLITDLSKTPLEELLAMLALEPDGLGFRKASGSWQKHLRVRCATVLGAAFSSGIDQALSDFFKRTTST
jgi:cytidylate kinase